LQICFAIWLHLSTGRRACTHGKADWIATNCSEFIGKDEWPPNSPDFRSLDYHVWAAILECYKSFQPKPENIDELKKVLQLIWDQLPRDSINKAAPY